MAEIWLRGPLLGADSESEVIFHILEANIKPILAISSNFASEKAIGTPYNRVAIPTIKDIDELILYFWMLYT